MHGIVAIASILALVTFAFGERAARFMAQAGLLAGLAFFLYILMRLIEGSL